MAFSGNIKGITIEFNGDTSRLEDALKNVDSQARKINSALKDVNSALKFSPTNTELLAQKQQLLAQKIQATKDRLSMLNQTQREAQQLLKDEKIGQDEFDALRREIIKTESQLKTFEAQFRQLGSVKLTAMSEQFKSWGKSLESAGRQLQPLSTALGAVAVASVKVASDWDSAWAGVQRRVKGTDEQMREIKDSIFELAQSSASSTEEVARVVEVAGQLGIATENVMEFAKVMIQLGDTTTMTAEEGAESLAKYANIVKLSADDYERLGSTILELGNNFATSETDIIQFAMRIAGSASQVGLTNQQIMALSASLSSVGLEAQAGGSAISKVITQIDKDVALGKDTMETWARVAGTSIEDFTQRWQAGGDSTYEMIQLIIKGMGEQKDAGENLNVILDELGITNLRTSDTMKRLSNASELVASTTETANKAWSENTSLQKNSAITYETMSAQLNQMKEALKEVGIEIGNEMLPYLRDFVDWIKDLTKRFKSLSPEAKQMAVRLIGIGTAMSPLLITTGKLFTSFGSIAGGMSKLTGVLKEGESGWAKAIVTMGKFAPAVGVVGGALALGVKWFKDYNEVVHGHSNNVKAMAEAHEQSIASIVSEAREQEKLTDRLDDLMAVEDKSVGQKQAIKTIVDELNQSLEGLNLSYDEENDALLLNGERVDDVTSAIRDQIEAQKELMMQNAFSKNAEEALETYAQKMLELGDAEAELLEKQERLNELNAEGVDSTSKNSSEYIKLSQEVGKLQHEIIDLNNAMGLSLIEYQKNINAGQMMGTAWKELETQASASGIAIPNSLMNGIKTGMVQIPTTMEELQALIEWQTAVDNAGESGTAVVNELTYKMLDGKISVTDATAELNKAMKDKFGEMPSDAQQLGTDTADAFAQGERNGKSNVTTASGEVMNSAGTELAKGKTVGYTAGADLVSETGRGIVDGKGTLGAKAREAMESAKSNAKTVSFTSLGEDAVGGATSGMNNAMWRLADKARQMMRNALASAKAEAKIASPSKIWRDEIGWNMGEGVAVGLEDAERVVDKASENMMVSALTNAKNGLKELETIQAGIQSTMTAGNQLSPSLAGASYNSAMQGAVQGLNSNDNMTALFNQLFRILGNGKIQVVLDSGKVVGELAMPMNQALNEIQVRQERG